MISKRLLQLALVALSASQVAQAHYGLPIREHGVVADHEGVANADKREVNGFDERLVKRQTRSSASSAPGNTAQPTSASSNAPPSTTSPPAPTTNRPTSSATPSPTPSDQPTTQPTSTKPNPTDSSSSKSDAPSDTKTSDPPKITSTLPPTTSTVIETVTNTDGSISTKTSETVTTPTVLVPDPNQSGNSNNNTGMSPQTRNTIIGVVVGVGGAIILGVIGLCAWRMWGRKKAAEQDDGLMNYGTPGYHPGPAEPKEPSVPGSSSVGTAAGRSPFQSTLESYHAPTQVNTASNF